MTEPTRPIRQPTVDPDGSLVAHTVATPKSFKIRARVTVGSTKVIPVIFVPGIMGTNLRVRRDTQLPEGLELRPGEAAWRPPNGSLDGFREARKWRQRDPAQRQWILDPKVLEVDNMGELDYSGSSLAPKDMRERGWGEIHAASYGSLLVDLQRQLDKTFLVNSRGEREVRDYWKRVMKCEPARWGVRSIEPVTETELEKYAAYQYPVYAVGYNWLESCSVSAKRLRVRINEIKEYWTSRKHECEKVILVTHSMGGLVARACVRLKSAEADDILGVIHGVMPALGAPVAYRRIACGTEAGSFSNGFADNVVANAFAEIAGVTAAETTPVLAASAGALQLLPNQLYPRPWLMIKTVRSVNNQQTVRGLLALPVGSPYELYRDMESWYRMINPALADPAKKYKHLPGGVKTVIVDAIDEAEEFHTKVLVTSKAVGDTRIDTPFYHPNTYAFYGADEAFRSYGQIQWVAREQGEGSVLTSGNIRHAKVTQSFETGAREVEVEGRFRLIFKIWPQEATGDETVPGLSGAGPEGHVKQVFSTRGYRHQESFQHSDMLLLTRHLIVKIVQGAR